jgi:hypothetical protein
MANRRWLGKAKAVRQVDTITIANTWATSDTCTITIDGIDLVVTIGANTTTAQVATTLSQAINGSTVTDTTATVSPTIADSGGQGLNQFDELIATVSGSVVTVTGGQTGYSDKPFTMSVVEVTAGSGTSVEATATAATGPHHINNADNWSSDTLPVDDDVVIFDEGAIDAVFNLGALLIQPSQFIKTRNYTGKIGLAQTNEDTTSKPYPEYRAKYWLWSSDVGTAVTTIDLEGGEVGVGSKLVRINAADCVVIWNQYGSGTRLITGQPTCLFLGTSTTNVFNIPQGDLGISFFEGEAAHIATLRVGDGETGNATVICGGGVDITNAAIEQNGGTLSIDSTTSSGTIVVSGTGVLTVYGTTAHASIDLRPSSTCKYNSSGTITTLKVQAGATWDRSGDIRTVTVTNVVNLFDGGSIKDPHSVVTFSGGIKANGFNLASGSGTMDVGPDRTYSLS